MPDKRKLDEAEERRVLHALRWEWQQTRDYYLASAEQRLLREPVFALSDGVDGWGSWTGAPVNELRVSRRLVLQYSWDAVCEVLRHEMAHQIAEQAYAAHGEPAHGPAFRRACATLCVEPAARRRLVPLDARLRAATAGRNAGAITVKIRKLLALAGSTNRHEAAAAAGKAYELCVKHNLAVLETDAARDFFSVTLGEPVLRRPFHLKALANLLGDYYFVQVIWIRRYLPESGRVGTVLEASGTAQNIAMAGYVHDFVTHFIATRWRAHRRAGRMTGGFRAFAAGVTAGIEQKLAATRAAQAGAGGPGAALVRITDPRLAAYVRQRYPRLRQRPAYSRMGLAASAYRRGFADGRTAVIRRPVAAGPAPRRRLGARRRLS